MRTVREVFTFVCITNKEHIRGMKEFLLSVAIMVAAGWFMRWGQEEIMIAWVGTLAYAIVFGGMLTLLKEHSVIVWWRTLEGVILMMTVALVGDDLLARLY